MRTSSDEEDAERAAAGDVDAFERLYRRHVARVHRLARRLLGPDQADDATQDVFLRAWSKLAGFRGTGSFAGWLHRLARNHMLNLLTRPRPEEEAPGRDDRDPDELVAATAEPARSLDLESAIARLPPGAREVLVLRDLEGYSHGEIAATLGISVGTSKSQLHRARTLLRRALEAGVATREATG